MCARCPWLKRGRSVAEPKELVAAAIAKAQENLEEALAGLVQMPAFDTGSVAFASHALNNYLNVTGALVELILLRLADHADADLRTWLHVTGPCQHSDGSHCGAIGAFSRDHGSLLRLERDSICPRWFSGPAANTSAWRSGNRSAWLLGSRHRSPAGVGGSRPQVKLADPGRTCCPTRSSIRRPTQRSGVLLRGGNGWVVCSVQDEGPGLSPDDQAKLFQRGVQLTPKPTGGEPTTGYGLAVAKELVERLGGTDLVPKANWERGLASRFACLFTTSRRMPSRKLTYSPEFGEAGRPNNDS